MTYPTLFLFLDFPSRLTCKTYLGEPGKYSFFLHMSFGFPLLLSSSRMEIGIPMDLQPYANLTPNHAFHKLLVFTNNGVMSFSFRCALYRLSISWGRSFQGCQFRIDHGPLRLNRMFENSSLQCCSLTVLTILSCYY